MAGKLQLLQCAFANVGIMQGIMGEAATAADLATADAVVAAAPHAGAIQPLHLEHRVVPHHPPGLGEVVHLVPAAQPRRRGILLGLTVLCPRDTLTARPRNTERSLKFARSQESMLKAECAGEPHVLQALHLFCKSRGK